VLASAEVVGAAATLHELAREYALQRHQFGHPIGSFQAVRHLLADMLVQLERLVVEHSRRASLDEQTPRTRRGPLAIAKAYAAVRPRRWHRERCRSSAASPSPRAPGAPLSAADPVRGGTFGSARDHERALPAPSPP
jgi:hypothetical protein